MLNFENIKNKEDLERVSRAENTSLAGIANGRGSTIDRKKKRTWKLNQKGAVTPVNPIGGEV